jgi:hypothetical protein
MRSAPFSTLRTVQKTTKLAAKKWYTAGTKTRRGKRDTSAPKSGFMTSVPASVPRKSQFSASLPADAPIS